MRAGRERAGGAGASDARTRGTAIRRRAIRRRRAVALGVAALAVAILAVRGIGDGSSAAADLPPAAQATTPPAPLARNVRIAAVGDTVMGSLPYGLPPDGGRSLFTAVKPLLVGDIVMANFEGTFATAGTSKCGPKPGPNCFAFHTPPSYVRLLKDAGIRVVSVANNHASDFGAIGRSQTRAVLASAGIRATGWPGSIAYVTAAGGTVAVVAFAFDGSVNSMLDIPAAKALVAKAAARAPVVIVTMHAGAEGTSAEHVRPGTERFLGENRGDSIRFTHAVVDAGADIVIGHGPHVMRGIQFYKGRPIVYSLGNFMGYAVFSLRGATARSAVLDVELGPDGRFVAGRMHAVRLAGKGVPVPGGDMTRVRDLSIADFGASGAAVDADGSFTPRAR